MEVSNEEVEVRPIVMAFARAMESQLRKHDDDFGESWRGMNPTECVAYIVGRLVQLNNTIGSSDYEETCRQAASVAAAALFAADNFGDLRNLLD